MLKTAALAFLAALALAGCGGGGDADGEQVLVQATTTRSEADVAGRTINDWLLDTGSPASSETVAGPYRTRACVNGTWRQTLKSAADLRLTVKVYGTTVRTINHTGVAGTDNRIAFSGCAETIGNVPSGTKVSGSASFELNARSNRAASPVDGYDLTIDWVVTRVQ
jgi:hypothetical protein